MNPQNAQTPPKKGTEQATNNQAPVNPNVQNTAGSHDRQRRFSNYGNDRNHGRPGMDRLGYQHPHDRFRNPHDLSRPGYGGPFGGRQSLWDRNQGFRGSYGGYDRFGRRSVGGGNYTGRPNLDRTYPHQNGQDDNKPSTTRP